MDFFGVHQSYIRVYPWDLDVFWELNNGRTLTLYDIPRVALAERVGLWHLLKTHKIGMTVAGSSIQYRKRITLWQKITMTAQCLGFDERFFYIVQNTYRGDEPCGQALLRMAFVKDGILSPKDALALEFGAIQSPPLPDWIKGYVKASAGRPWPPENALIATASPPHSSPQKEK